jgi:hypothetical protein
MIAYGRGTDMSGRGFVSVLCALIAGCAGTDTPPRSDQLDRDIQAAYGDGGSSMATGGAGGGDDPGIGGSSMAAGGRGTTPVGRGGAGPSSGGSGSGAAVCDAPTKILIPRCGSGSSCHGSGSINGDFGVSEAAAKALVDKPSQNGAGCGLYINSSSPDDSLLLTKVNDTFNKGQCGPLQMPLTGAYLTDDEEACIQDWLSQF